MDESIIEENRRISRLIQALIDWIFRDPGAERRYEALGVPGRVGYLTRAAPLAAAGDGAVIAAFSTIHPNIVRFGIAAIRNATTFEVMWATRDEAVVEGLRSYLTGDQCDALAEQRERLWQAVEACPLSGRTFFGAHLALGRPGDPMLSAWHGANDVGEWRADTHMAILLSEDLNAAEASILHSAWIGYPHDWVPKSRGWNDQELAAGFAALEAKGLADAEAAQVNERGIALREHIEQRTDELSSTPWATDWARHHACYRCRAGANRASAAAARRRNGGSVLDASRAWPQPLRLSKTERHARFAWGRQPRVRGVWLARAAAGRLRGAGSNLGGCFRSLSGLSRRPA